MKQTEEQMRSMHTCMYTQPVNHSSIGGQQSQTEPAAVDIRLLIWLVGEMRRAVAVERDRKTEEKVTKTKIKN